MDQDRLPFVPAPRPDELLHSWVARLAHVYFQDPEGFVEEKVLRPSGYDARSFWGDDEILARQRVKPMGWRQRKSGPGVAWWSTAKAAPRLSDLTGIPHGEIQQMVPRRIFEERSNKPAEVMYSTGICPDCLLDDAANGRVPFIRRRWSHPWISHCQRHGRLLMTRSLEEIAAMFALAAHYRYLIPFLRMDYNVLRLRDLGYHIEDVPDWSGPFEGKHYDFNDQFGFFHNDLQNFSATLPPMSWNHEILFWTPAGVTFRELLMFEARLDVVFDPFCPRLTARTESAVAFAGEVVELDRLLSRHPEFFRLRKVPLPILLKRDANLCELVGAVIYHQAFCRLPAGEKVDCGEAMFDAAGIPLWTTAFGNLAEGGRLSFQHGGNLMTIRERMLHNLTLTAVFSNAELVHPWKRGEPARAEPVAYYLAAAIARGTTHELDDEAWAFQGQPRLEAHDSSAIKALLARGVLLRLANLPSQGRSGRGVLQGLAARFAARQTAKRLPKFAARSFMAKGFRLPDEAIEAVWRRRAGREWCARWRSEEAAKRIHWLPSLRVPKTVAGSRIVYDAEAAEYRAASHAIQSPWGQYLVRSKPAGWWRDLFTMADKMLQHYKTAGEFGGNTE